MKTIDCRWNEIENVVIFPRIEYCQVGDGAMRIITSIECAQI